MQTKNIVIASVTALLIWQILPPAISDKITGTFTVFSNERQCFNFHKNTFKDPYSAYVLGSYTDTKETASKFNPNKETRFKDFNEFIVVRVYAKNGFGAYGNIAIECPLIDHSFSETYALIHRSNQHMNEQQLNQ